MFAGQDLSGGGGRERPKTPSDILDLAGPHAVDQLIRQAMSLCWMMLPRERQSVESVEAEMQRIVTRAIANFKEDSESFGVKKQD